MSVTPGTPTNLVTQDELTDTVEAERYRISGPPTEILDGETYIVPERRQVGFRHPIINDGVLQIDGVLYEV